MSFSILIVDDSEIIREVLERTIHMTKISFSNIFKASNGAEAITILKDQWVDLVFTDIHMPVMSGIELIEKMHTTPELRDTPVVVISTEGSTTRIDQLKAFDIKGYLRKPFTPESIRDIMSATLGTT
ncbi:MAG TPA: response regulator [Chitinispirillaceae bacterium]|nr:response regulator [Chitinispirillaceae bacterium]